LAVSVNSTLDLSRQQTLAKKGYVAQNVADLAKATAVSNLALVSSAQKNILLVQQKATADLETAHDTVAQAIQNVAAAQDALIAARAESYTVQAQIANVQDSVDAQRQAVAIHEIAIGNLTQILQYQQDVQQAQEAVQEAVGQVSFNQADYNKSYIRSPITGTVLQMTAQQGETVAAGLAAPTLIIVANLHKLQIDAFVDETDIAAVRLGQPAQIVLDAFPKHVFTGIVSKISAGSTIQNGVVTYDVTAAIHQEPAYALKPDMTATVVIVTGHRHNVLLLPSVAIQVGVKGSTVNLMIQQKGKTVVQSVPVMTGGTDGTNTEVTSGLTEGQTVIEAGAPPVTTGSGGTAHSSSPFSAPSHGGGGGVGGRRG